MWYALHNGPDRPSCSMGGAFTANRQGVSSVTPPYPAPCTYQHGHARFLVQPACRQVSSSSVMGPSLTDETRMLAPTTPVATVQPRDLNSATTASTSGSATSPGAASCHDGRRPFRVSA